MIKFSRFIIVFILLGAAGLYVNFHADITVPMNRSFTEFPTAVGQWRMVSQDEFSENILEVLRPTDYLSRTYVGGDGRKVELYIGYHGGGKSGGEIHSPKHCLPGSGWYEASSSRSEMDVGSGKINLVRAVYQKGEEKDIFLYWFQVRDRSLSDEYSLKLAEISGSMLYRRRDASFIRISVPVGNGLEQATATGERFVRDFYPVIREFLPG